MPTYHNWNSNNCESKEGEIEVWDFLPCTEFVTSTLIEIHMFYLWSKAELLKNFSFIKCYEYSKYSIRNYEYLYKTGSNKVN